MNLLTIITPIAPYHAHLRERVEATVRAQTLPCDHLVYMDTDADGPAVLRNRGVSEAQTPFVTFLDADDTLRPDFAVLMLAHWQPDSYVYSDYWMDDVLTPMPDSGAMSIHDHHLVTCLLSRNVFLKAGGFPLKQDFEDTRFYVDLQYRGICGIRCPYPVVNYRGDGRRSSIAHQSPDWRHTLRELYRRYPSMCDCGNVPINEEVKGEAAVDTVLVRANWDSNRTRVGRVTGRLYPENGWRKLMYVARVDAEAQPDLFEIVDTPKADSYEDFETLKARLRTLTGVPA